MRAGRHAAALAALLSAGAATAAAQTPAPPRAPAGTPDSVRQLLGQWDLEQIGAPRRCTLTLGVEEIPHGRQLRFPATCRRALPILGGISAWTAGTSGEPVLVDAQGKPAITLGRHGDGFEGTGPDGKRYGLASGGYARAQRRPPPTQAEHAATAAGRPTPVDLASAPAPDTLPGRYVLMRQRNREACRLELTDEPRKALGGAVARFVGACADTGLSIFNPVGWRYAAGRLTLIAGRSHTVELVFEDGLWRKDPAVGAPLMMRKQP